MVDVIPVPDRLKQGIGETESQDILYGFFTQVVVNAENLLLRKNFGKQTVQLWQ